MERLPKQTFFIINRKNEFEAWKEDSATIDEPPEAAPNLQEVVQEDHEEIKALYYPPSP